MDNIKKATVIEIIEKIKARKQILETLKEGYETGITDVIRDKHLVKDYEKVLLDKAIAVNRTNDKITEYDELLMSIH